MSEARRDTADYPMSRIPAGEFTCGTTASVRAGRWKSRLSCLLPFRSRKVDFSALARHERTADAAACAGRGGFVAGSGGLLQSALPAIRPGSLLFDRRRRARRPRLGSERLPPADGSGMAVRVQSRNGGVPVRRAGRDRVVSRECRRQGPGRGRQGTERVGIVRYAGKRMGMVLGSIRCGRLRLLPGVPRRKLG